MSRPAHPALARLLADPTGSGAVAAAEEIFAALERRARPRAAELKLLVEHALLLARLGFAARGRSLFGRWRRSGVSGRGFDGAEAIFVVSSAPASAPARMRELAATDPVVAALQVVGSLVRGELRAAVAMARGHDWFLPPPAGRRRQSFPHDTLALGYALWALVLLGEHATAADVIARWKARSPRPAPRDLQMRLALETLLAAQRLDYAREEALAREALAVCAEDDALAIERAVAETILAVARARNNDVAGAERMAASWPADPGQSILNGQRDLSRMDIALLGGRYREASAAGRRAVAFCRASENVVWEMRACCGLVLAAGSGSFAAALAEYRRVVHRHPIPMHVSRLKLLERFAAAGGQAAREPWLIERSRWDTMALPLWRLWTPRPEAVGADLYWDQVQGRLHLSGRGPFSLSEHPVLERFLAAVLDRPSFAAPLVELFAEVWQVPWSLLQHEHKCHVTLHRLRAWLAAQAGHDRPLLVIRDGVVAVAADLDVRVVQARAEPLRMPEPDLLERVRDALATEASTGAAELERRVGVSRSALHGALRRLVAAGKVAREGSGPSVRYRLA